MAKRALAEIAVRFLGAYLLDMSLDAYLSLEWRPEEDQGGTGIGRQRVGHVQAEIRHGFPFHFPTWQQRNL